MKTNFLFWLKIYLGFSRKESKGFLLFIPFLSVLVVLPSMIQYFERSRAKDFHIDFQNQLDSLSELGFPIMGSFGPVFNPKDTVKKTSIEKQLDHINQVPFVDADSIILQIVPGIGASTAGRIIKYRERLGGFQSKEQLLEVFGLKSETIELLWEFFEFSPEIHHKITINSATIDDIYSHPYISYGEAKVLIAFRKQHGPFSSPDDLLKVKIFKEEWIKKIAPYLDFEL